MPTGSEMREKKQATHRPSVRETYSIFHFRKKGIFAWNECYMLCYGFATYAHMAAVYQLQCHYHLLTMSTWLQETHI